MLDALTSPLRATARTASGADYRPGPTARQLPSGGAVPSSAPSHAGDGSGPAAPCPPEAGAAGSHRLQRRIETAVTWTAVATAAMLLLTHEAAPACDAKRASFVTGHRLSGELVERAGLESQAAEVRVVVPGRPLAAEPDRLNLLIDESGTIVAARCGEQRRPARG